MIVFPRGVLMAACFGACGAIALLLALLSAGSELAGGSGPAISFAAASPAGIGALPAAATETAAPQSPAWRQRAIEAFTLLAGDVAGAGRVAVLAGEGGPLPPGRAPPPYDAVLGLNIAARGDPAAEARKLHAALETLRGGPSRVDLWAQGLAGLVARQAIEQGGAQAAPVHTVVLVDTPHRGLSASGWPRWDGGELNAGARRPAFAISGSPFLLALNRAPAPPAGIAYVNIWRRTPKPAPRASVMRLPVPAVLAVMRAGPGDPIWSLLDARVSALRVTAQGGTPRRSTGPGAASLDQAVQEHAPRRAPPAPLRLRDLLDGAGTVPPQAARFWLEFESADAAAGFEGELSRITDPIAIGYNSRTGQVAISGFEDYFREPLSADLFWAALRAYRSGIPAISIDPPRAGDPPNQAPVRYEGGVQGTRLGGLMFEADRVMKSLGLGRDNVTESPVGAAVPGHRSVAEASAKETSSGETVWRLWLQPLRWHAREPNPDLAFIEARIQCLWEKMTPTYAPSQGVSAFTRRLTEQYALYAQEQPAFDHLDQAAALVAMARWAYEAGLDVPAKQQASITAVKTPAYTPLTEVRTKAVSEQYEVTHILQGGTVLGSPLRHVPAAREDSRLQGALLARALAQTYAAPQAPLFAGRRQFTVEDMLLHETLLPVVSRGAGRRTGIRKAAGRLSDPVLPPERSYEAIFPLNRPLISGVTLDDSAEPPLIVVSGTAFGGQPGAVAFRPEGGIERLLAVRQWSSNRVTVTLPGDLRSGALVLRSAQGESLPVEVRLIGGVAPRRPPEVNVTNLTAVPLVVDILPNGRGSVRMLQLAPGEKGQTRVLPGRYSIRARSTDPLTLGVDRVEEKEYERDHVYSITYEPRTFSVGTVTVRNDTGGALTLMLSGPVNQTLEVPGGRPSTVRLPLGNYKITVKSRCGTGTETLNVISGSVSELSYACTTVPR
jgi:hypothetical protein